MKICQSPQSLSKSVGDHDTPHNVIVNNTKTRSNSGEYHRNGLSRYCKTYPDKIHNKISPLEINSLASLDHSSSTIDNPSYNNMSIPPNFESNSVIRERQRNDNKDKDTIDYQLKTVNLLTNTTALNVIQRLQQINISWS